LTTFSRPPLLSINVLEGQCARAMLDRITHITSDLESAKAKAKSLFDTLNMPQTPRLLADFGPVRARGVFLDAEAG